MPQLVALMKWEVIVFLGALAGVVAVQMLTGQINTSGLLYGHISGRRRGEDEYFSPERVQLLVLTLGAAFYYLSEVLNNPNTGTFPPLPESWVALLGGSHLVFLGGKSYARWFAGSNSK